MAEGVSQTDFLELLDNFVLLYITIACYCMYNRLFSVSGHTKLSAIKDMSRIHTLFISTSKKVNGRGCGFKRADWTNRSVRSCHNMRRKFRHVLTNIIVLFANCILLCEQFRQYFVPSTMRYVPLGLKSTYNLYYTNSLVFDKDKIIIRIKDSWTILTCIAWQFANRKKDSDKRSPWPSLHVLF